MKKICGLLALMIVCTVGATAVMAGDRVGVGLKLGTYGLGGDVGVAVNDHIAFRGSLQWAEPSITETLEDVEYEADITLGGYGLLIDVFPFGGQFRVSAGIFSNRNEFNLSGVTLEDTEIGNGIYTPAEVGVLTGTIDFGGTAPYLGIGWGNIARGKKRLRFLIEGGVLKQGSGQVSLMSSTGLVDPSDLAQEAAEIQDEISDYDLWPVISVGLGIRF